MQLSVVVLKSLLTSGSVSYPMIPRISEQSFTARLTVSSLTSISTCTVRSTQLTFGVGTLMLLPLILLVIFGYTKLSALAAPVLVGIMLTPPALDLYGSLCFLSIVAWSPV